MAYRRRSRYRRSRRGLRAARRRGVRRLIIGHRW